MAFSTHSDPYVAAAFWTGLGALLLTVLLGLQILRLRMALRLRERQEARALAKWRPLLNAATMGEVPDSLPPLERNERLPLLKAWVHLQASMRGDAQDALNDMARRLALDAFARDRLARGRRAEQLLACLVLGYLRDTRAWPYLQNLARLRDDTLALNAMWAMARIDPQAASASLIKTFIEQDHWAISRVIGILQEAREAAAIALTHLLPGLDTMHLTRALRIAEAMRLNLPAGLLAKALHSQSVSVIVAGLRSVADPANIGEVRALLAHEDWQVRLQAVKALGRIGSRADASLLLPALQDRQWWVRYRAAQALLDLPGVSEKDLDSLRASLPDRFAIDMLAQAMAERGMA